MVTFNAKFCSNVTQISLHFLSPLFWRCANGAVVQKLSQVPKSNYYIIILGKKEAKTIRIMPGISMNKTGPLVQVGNISREKIIPVNKFIF